VQTPSNQPFVVTIVPETPSEGMTVPDLLIGSMGITGVLVLVALVLGVLFAGVRLGWNRLHPASDDRLPPVSPFVQDPAAPPSSQAR
jgi:hypothetical protein